MPASNRDGDTDDDLHVDADGLGVWHSQFEPSAPQGAAAEMITPTAGSGIAPPAQARRRLPPAARLDWSRNSDRPSRIDS